VTEESSKKTVSARRAPRYAFVMLYAILCYDSEEAVGSWTKEQDDVAIERLMVVQEKWKKEGRLGPVARLEPTKTAKTLRKGAKAMVLDGPFAETKEHLLGFFIVECASPEDAMAAAKELGSASSTAGSYEVRPLRYFGGGTVAGT
jgi:hypothetical protein